MDMIKGLLAGPYAILIKIAVVVLTILLLFGSGYWAGCSHANKMTQSAVTKTIIRQIKSAPIHDTKIIHDLQVIHLKGAETLLEVPNFVQINPDCDVGPDVIKLLNTNRSSLPAVPRNDETGAAAATNQ